MTTRLETHFNKIILYDLILQNSYSNFFKIPRINSINLNFGLKDFLIDSKKILNILIYMELLINQKPVITKSKKNILTLKIKKGNIVGCKLTLRGKNLFIFLEKFIYFHIFKKNVQINFNKNQINSKIINFLNFFEFKNEFTRFLQLPPLDVNIKTSTSTKKELIILINNFNLN